jgi:hypothetical protein
MLRTHHPEVCLYSQGAMEGLGFFKLQWMYAIQSNITGSQKFLCYRLRESQLLEFG